MPARSRRSSGLTDSAGKELRSGFADPNLRPAIVGVFTDLTGPAPPGLSLSAEIDTRFSTTANGFEAHRDDRRDRGHHRRAVGAVAAGPRRRPPDAPADPGPLAVLHGHRRRGRRRLPGVAHHRRELLRRRLHPADGPHRRRSRLHVELLPLVRQPRGPVRLVLQRARADDPRQRRQHLDAAARPGLRAGLLAAAVPRSAAAARPGGGVQQGRDVGGGPGAAGGVDAVQQRPAPGRPDRHRRADHLRADRTRDHLRAADPGRAGDRDRRVHARHPADRADRGGRPAGRRPPAAANPGATTPRDRHLAVGGASAGSRVRRTHRGVRRPDAGNGVGGHQDSHGDRPEPAVVHREPALLLPDPAHRRRVAVTAVRVPDHRAVAVRVDVHHVAAQADSRGGARSGVAADGRDIRHRCSS